MGTGPGAADKLTNGPDRNGCVKGALCKCLYTQTHARGIC